jgi:hypothetical protein
MILVCALSETTTFALWKRAHTHTLSVCILVVCMVYNVHARARLALVWMRALAHVRAGVHAAIHTQHSTHTHTVRAIGLASAHTHTSSSSSSLSWWWWWWWWWCAMHWNLENGVVCTCDFATLGSGALHAHMYLVGDTDTVWCVCFCARAFLHAQCWLFLLVAAAAAVAAATRAWWIFVAHSCVS